MDDMEQQATLEQGRGTARARVAASLRADILEGRLAPGAPLRTEAVMERFGVSNSPLREAFAQLAAEGLVEVNRNRGAMVAPLTREGAADLLRVSDLVWDGALRWIVPGLTPAHVEGLKRTDVNFGLAVRSGDLSSAILDAERFQQQLLESCDSPELVRMIETSRPRVLRVFRMLASLPVMDVITACHAEVLAAAGTTEVDRSAEAFHLLWSELGSTLQRSPGLLPSS
jgi:DNA-binding GntR family transcriptional regulator